MTRLIGALSEISEGYEALLCDLWGCLHNGHAPFPGAVAALQAFRKGGGRVALLTNAPRPNPSVIAQLDGLGVPRDAWDIVVTSGDAAQQAMVAGLVGRRVHHIGAPKDEPFFSDMPSDPEGLARITRVPLAEAEGLVVTGLRDDATETPEDYREELLDARTRGLTMLCANPDILVHHGERVLWCAGALARDYAEAGGKVLYFGKPHSPVYELARNRLRALGCSARDDALLAVGDGIDTDIRGGLAEGIDTLFVTGGIAFAEFGPDPDAPDPEKLDAWLAERQLSPTAAIAKLR